MRFIRSRFGLIFWCAIALLILAVPLWRLRAARQWQLASVQSALMPDYFSAPVRVAGQPDPTPAPIPYGFSAAAAQTVAQRLPDEAVAQLVRLNTGDLTRQVNAIFGTVSLGSYAEKDYLARQKAQLQKLYPRVWKLTDAYFAQYDALVRRFPDSELVRAQYLRDVLSMTNITDEGPFPEKDAAALARTNIQALYYASPASPATIKNAIQSARAGARLRPDNAYFPWAEAVFQFAQKRPHPALNALEAAGRCANFDDYTYFGLEQRIALLKRLQTVGWEDELTEWAGFLFPHYGKMRSAAGAATGQMRLARRRGDSKAAFRWIAALARASYPVARCERNSVLCKLVGQELCSISWNAAIENESNIPKISPDIGQTEGQRYAGYRRYYESLAARFTRFARAGGDEALARQTLVTVAGFDVGQLANSVEFSAFFLLLRRLSDFYWLGAQLLRLALASALAWIVCWLVTRKRAVQVAATRRRMLLPAMFCAGATGAILSGALTLVPKLDGIFNGFAPSDDKSLSIFVLALRDYWPALIGLVWAFVILGIPLWSRVLSHKGKSKRLATRAKISVSLARLVAGLVAVAALLGVVFWLVANAPSDQLAQWLARAPAAAAYAVAVSASLALIWCARGPKRAVAICGVAAFWLFIAASFAQSSEGDGQFYAGLLQILAVLLVIIAPVLALRIWKLPVEAIKESVFQIAARTRIAAGVLALLCAVAYLGLALWTVPVEAKTRAMMGRQLQIGEVAWLREQNAAQK